MKYPRILLSLLMISMLWACGDDEGDTPTPDPTLNVPTGLSSSNISDTSFEISWNAVTDATSYTVQVSTDNEFGSFELNQSGITGTSESISGLTAETTYFVRVNAANTNVTSDFSSMLTVTTLATPEEPTEIAAPQAEAATEVSQTSFTANWSSVAGATAYFLDVASASDFSTLILDNESVNGTSFEVTALTAATEYFYRVRSTNGTLTSDNSNTASLTTAEEPAPGELAAPVAAAATGITETSFTANWSAVDGATSYTLEVSTSIAFNLVADITESTTETSFEVTGLVANTDYFYRVYATDGTTTSESSNTINAMTMDDAPTGGGDGEYLITTVQTTGADVTTTTISYNSSCQVIESSSEGTSEGTPFTSTSDYVYDAQGRLVEINTDTDAGGFMNSSSIAYNGFNSEGFPLQIVIGTGTPAGNIVYDYNYASDGKVESVVQTLAGITATYTYTYTGNNVTRIDQSGLLGTAQYDFTYTTEGSNFYRYYLELGIVPPTLYFPYAFSEDLISGFTFTLAGVTTESTIEYTFNSGDLPLTQTTTSTAAGVTTVSTTENTYAADCN